MPVEYFKHFSKERRQRRPLVPNKAIQGTYPPGSDVQLATFISASRTEWSGSEHIRALHRWLSCSVPLRSLLGEEKGWVLDL